MTHKIVVVYQSLLGIYGDRGNAMVLVKRLVWRGIDAELIMVEPGDPVPDDGLIYLLGGGEDWAQIAAVKALEEDRGLHRGLDAGGVLFAVCAGYQLCGHSFTVGDNDVYVGSNGTDAFVLVDTNASGAVDANDLVIKLAGITTVAGIDSNNFVF